MTPFGLQRDMNYVRSEYSWLSATGLWSTHARRRDWLSAALDLPNPAGASVPAIFSSSRLQTGACSLLRFLPQTAGSVAFARGPAFFCWSSGSGRCNARSPKIRIRSAKQDANTAPITSLISFIAVPLSLGVT
jgi:hypothetical protein